MQTVRQLLLALLTTASLLAPSASQAETIFERFAPPLPPLPHIVIRSTPEPVWRDDRRDWHGHRDWRDERYGRRYDERYEPRHHHHRHHDRHDHRRDWR